jgi:outer membrane protein assembly factor BamB
MRRAWLLLVVSLHALSACGEAKRRQRGGDDASDAGAAGEPAAPAAGGASAGRGTGAAGNAGNAGGRSAGAAGASGGQDGGAAGEDAIGNPSGASGTGGSAAGSGAGGAGAGAGGANGPLIGPRCTDCPTPCLDETLRPPQLVETCTEPSPFAGLGVRFDVTVTLGDGSKRYLVDSPFDYDSDNYPSWSEDSLGMTWYSQGLVCGKISVSQLVPGPLDPESASALVVTVEDVEYRSTNAPASAEFIQGEPSPGSDPELGPMFDLLLAGTLVSDEGESVEVEGRLRNVTAGRGARGLGRREVEAFSVAGAARRLSIVGQDVLLGPVTKTGQGTDFLLFDRALGAEVVVPLASPVLTLVPFAGGGVLGTGNLDPFLAAFETSGALRYQSPTLAGDSLSSGYEPPIARSDGSGCLAAPGGPSFADEARPSALACTDAAGGLAFQTSLYPIIQPLAPTELADGGIVVLDARSPRVRGFEPDGTPRFELETCSPPGSGAQLPYFSGALAARNTDGGWVAQIGDDVVAVTPGGALRWRTAVPFGDSTPLVAADGTIYAMTRGPAILVALEPNGAVRWTLPVGESGDLVGLAADGTIYATAGSWYDYGLLLAISAEGSLLWSALTATTNWVLAAEGDLYGVSLDPFAIERVQGDSPLATAPWPAPRGDARAAGTL